MSAQISIRIVGVDGAIANLRDMPRRVDAALQGGLSAAVLYLEQRVKENLTGNTGDFPHWRSGKLARAVTSSPAEPSGAGFVARVGVLAIVPYAEILEKGGYIPEHEVWAGIFTGRSNKKALAWPVGFKARAMISKHLAARATGRQAQRRTGKALGWSGFANATHVTIKGRQQRAIPYLSRTLEEEMPAVTALLRARVLRALPRSA